jgi:hypothetical protein
MPRENSFSRRHGYRTPPNEITVREDAPEELRFVVLQTARDLEWSPTRLRGIVCDVLRVRPDPSNWSDYHNIWDEVQGLVYSCDWFKIYDIIEGLQAAMARHDEQQAGDDAQRFAADINAYFLEEGIGWQLVDGRIVTRGMEAFEVVVKDAGSVLEESGRPTAAGHVHEALADLSRRPQADLAGAIYHAMGALEAVARDLAGDAKLTLGEVLKRHRGLLPRPLDSALAQIWGYASNEARHVEEGRQPSREEAEFLVGLAAVMATYLTKKQ